MIDETAAKPEGEAWRSVALSFVKYCNYPHGAAALAIELGFAAREDVW